MEAIFHEKQDGLLCAQHCLNSLLQGPYYTAADLAAIAESLDVEERRQMASGREGENSADYRRFLEASSVNMDDTGFFSIQVINKALQVWGLDMVSYSSSNPAATAAVQEPTNCKAYICNFKEHWLTIRKIGNQWFNLNSLLTGPELISNTFLVMFLTQLQAEGYAIYIVLGVLPVCPADEVLLSPVVQTSPPRLLGEGRGRSSDSHEVQEAMSMSLGGGENDQSQDEELKLALQMSRSMMETESLAVETGMRESMSDQSNVVSEEDDIQKAIALSLQNVKEEEKFQKAVELSLESARGSRPTTQGQRDKDHDNQPRSAQGQRSAGAHSTQDKTMGGAKPKTPQKEAPTTLNHQEKTPDIPFTCPKAPRSIPGPFVMPGEGQKLNNDLSSTERPTKSTPDPEEVRRRRLAFLNKVDGKKS